MIDLKDLLTQLEPSKSSIKDLFKYFLNEIEGFKYQITVATLLYKHKINGDIEHTYVYSNSETKKVNNSDKYDLEKSFQEILCSIENWINERSGWII